jgi:NADH:ubiquinone oxidoreductase subunit F (NADH-binding)
MDRSVLEGDPHSVIEGMAIAAYAIGASRATSTCAPNIRWPSSGCARPSTRRAPAACWARTSSARVFFDLEIRMGSGAFVCGEETALMTSIEGKRGEPRPRPPFPAQKGLWGKPTVLNNVETYANVPRSC